MIDPETMKPELLPSLPLQWKQGLPECPGIYFAINSLGLIQYIGRSENIRRRWFNHHRYEYLSAQQEIRIAWVEVSDLDFLPSIESALIEWFRPPLNSYRLRGAPVIPLIKLREESGLSQLQLASLIGVTDQSISNWESGRSTPHLNPRQMFTLCSALNCTLEQLADITDKKLKVQTGN